MLSTKVVFRKFSIIPIALFTVATIPFPANHAASCIFTELLVTKFPATIDIFVNTLGGATLPHPSIQLALIPTDVPTNGWLRATGPDGGSAKPYAFPPLGLAMLQDVVPVGSLIFISHSSNIIVGIIAYRNVAVSDIAVSIVKLH